MPVGRYGFLQTLDGREIYFHENSLVDGDFNDLEVGQEMVFVEEAGDKGPQASTVKPVGRHHHAR
jgi:cold shock CspA family protein